MISPYKRFSLLLIPLTIVICLIVVAGGCGSRSLNFGVGGALQGNGSKDSLLNPAPVVEPAIKKVTDSSSFKSESLIFSAPIAGGIATFDMFKAPTASVASEERAAEQPQSSQLIAGSTIATVPLAPSAGRSAPVPSPTLVPTPISVAPPASVVEHRLARTTNILVLGSDRRRGTSNWRTDVIMIVALDLTLGEAGVISLPRDIYIEEIPNAGPNRINVVDYLGERIEPGYGPRLLAELLSQRLGFSIDHYVRFEFESFKNVVDALGGISVTVDCAVFDEIEEEDLYINLRPGTHRLNGEEALAYVRTRRAGGDLERIRRQQRLIWALRQQFLDQNWLPKVPALYSSLSDAIQTDLNVLDVAQLIRFGINVSEAQVHGLVISPPMLLTQDWHNGMFVFLADWPRISQTMETVFDRPPFESTNTVGPGGDRSYCP